MYLNIHIKRTDVCKALLKGHLGDGVAGGKRVSRVCSNESGAEWRYNQVLRPLKEGITSCCGIRSCLRPRKDGHLP